MTIINVEVYSIILLFVLFWDYFFKFYKKNTTPSLLWLTLTCSTAVVSISNIIFYLSNNYTIKLIAVITYLLSILICSLFVYLYVKVLYIKPDTNISKEFIYVLLSIIICIVLTILYVFFFESKYLLHSFDRKILNRLLMLAIIPNISILVSYINHNNKNNISLNPKIVLTLLLTIVGLLIDILCETLYFVSSTFTLTVLIIYINKHDSLLNTDPLTNLTNKRGLEIYLSNLSINSMYAVYNIDIDKFKNINDKYGHLQGDYVLKKVADILRNSSRISDLVVRNGGDEFIIIAKIKKENDLKYILDRINAGINKHNSNEEIKISLSIGSGIFRTSNHFESEDFSSFLKSIDDKMYIEKEKNHKTKM